MTLSKLPQSQFFSLYEIRDGVYAAIINPGEGAWGNAGIVDLGDFTLIIDTFLTPSAASDLRKIAEDLTNSPIKYVVNTHWHIDHTMGNQVFSDTMIISSKETYNIMKENFHDENKNDLRNAWEDFLKNLGVQKENARNAILEKALDLEIKELTKYIDKFESINYTLPNEIMSSSKYIVKGSKRVVELHCLGGGHSNSDTIVYLPEEKIAFTGDLVFVNAHPSIHNQPINKWLEILDKLDQFNIETVIAGHGEIGTKSTINIVKQYLLECIEVVKNDICSIEIPEKYSSWMLPHVYGWNLTTLKNQFNTDCKKSE